MAKGKRVKSVRPHLKEIKDWSEADKLVLVIGSLQGTIASAETDAKERIDPIKAKLAKDVKGSQEKIRFYTESLEAFATAHRQEFKKGHQSRKLNFGVVGWHKSTVIKVKKATAGLIEAVFGRRAAQYIHIKTTPDKEAMAKLTDEQLAKVAARREHKEVFFVEPDSIEAADHNG